MTKDATKKQGSVAPRALIKTRNFITVVGFPVITHQHFMANFSVD